MAEPPPSTSTSTSVPPTVTTTAREESSSSAAANPEQHPPLDPSQEEEPEPDPKEKEKKQRKPRLPIHTYHCRFCNHLLLASTRDIHRLPRRRAPAADGALILPLPPKKPSYSDSSDSESEPDPEGGPDGAAGPSPPMMEKRRRRKRQEHYTILLSTTIPDRKTTIVRREDGFEKRLLLRCGRCRVVMGYLLDELHFPVPVHPDRGDGSAGGGVVDEERERGKREDGEARVAYILPGAVVRTEEMGDEARAAGLDREWRGWVKS